jgi:hypothetical protein
MTPAEAETFKSSFGSRVRLFERVTVSEPGALSLAMGGENPVESHAALAKAVGSSSHEFMDGFIAEVAGVAYQKVEGELSPAPLNAMLAGIIGAAPKDELEAMLAAQMVATHSAMMAAMRRLAASSNIAQQDSNGNLVTKLSRTYTAQMEALARYRGKGTQRVVVEHVTTNVAVAPGGQANVGVVMAGDRAPGGGEQVEKGGQSHGRR